MGRTRSRRGKGSRRKRSSRQRAQDAAAAPAFEASRCKPIGLDSFAFLPHELRVHIVQLACSSTPPSARDTDPYRPLDPRTDRRAGLPHPQLDVATTLSLTFASKRFYELMAPILYRHVWLSRPSALASFHLALSEGPQLGGLIQSLHVGPEEVALGYGEPLTIDEGSDCGCCGPTRVYIHTSLQGESGRKLLPRWWEERNFYWDVEKEGYDPPTQAIHRALVAAQQDIDVHLGESRVSNGGQDLSEQQYTTRLWEVRAAFDAYLVAMRIWEDEQDVLDAKEGVEERHPHYPPLFVTGYPTSATPQCPSRRTEAPFVVSRASLLQHLTRAHSATDQFDHPLLFARSGLSERLSDYGGNEPDKRSRSDGAWASIFSPTTSSLDCSLPNTATVNSLLDLVRSVLVLTRSVETLSLTGFLELAVCSDFETTLALNTVRNLSIGPPPQRWLEPALLGTRFAAVEELRISGVELQTEEIDGILLGFPVLRKLTWSVAERYDQSQTLRWSITGRHEPGPSKSLRPIIDRLAGVGQALGDEQEGFAISTSASDGKSTSTHKNAVSDPLPLVEIRLDSLDLQNILQSVKDPAVRLAWSSGQPLPNQARRLLLTANPHTMARRVYYNEPNMPEEKDLFQEGREWWVERCARRGGASLG